MVAVRETTYLLPLKADLEVVVELDEIEQMLQDHVRFVLGHADDPTSEVRVDKNGLPPSDGVCPISEGLISPKGCANQDTYVYLMTGCTASSCPPTFPGEPRSPDRLISTLTMRDDVDRITITELVAQVRGDLVEESGFMDGLECFEVFGEGGRQTIV